MYMKGHGVKVVPLPGTHSSPGVAGTPSTPGTLSTPGHPSTFGIPGTLSIPGANPQYIHYPRDPQNDHKLKSFILFLCLRSNHFFV